MLRIREYRKNQSLTIKELSEQTGLSISYISQVERGEVDPSLSSLRKIAAVFQVPIYVLLDDSVQKENLTIRQENRISKHSENHTVTYTFLSPLPSPEFIPKSLLMEFEIQPDSQDTEFPLAHHSEEVIHILEGELTLIIGDSQIVLHPGDTSVVKEDLPHICKNTTDRPVRGVAAISPPVWGNMGVLTAVDLSNGKGEHHV